MDDVSVITTKLITEGTSLPVMSLFYHIRLLQQSYCCSLFLYRVLYTPWSYSYYPLYNS